MVLLILKFFVSTPGTAPPVFNVFVPKDDLRVLCSEQIYHNLGVGYLTGFSCERGFACKPIKNHLSRSYILEVIQKSRE